MRIIDIISEARKNPDLNPKISINQHIIDAYEKADTLPNSTIKNAFASFTEIDKLGINPGSLYNTPLGIYSYPLDHVVEVASEQRSMNSLPFAGESQYVNIFSVTGNIVNLNKMTNTEVADYVRKMGGIWEEISNKPWKTAVDELEDIVINSGTKAAFGSSPGGRFWYITYMLAGLISKKTNTKLPIAWNSLFRKLNIDGCVDSGVGIIHTSEPTQAVFFSLKPIVNNKRVYNKYSPESIRNAQWTGEMAQSYKNEIKNMTYDELIAAIKDNPYYIKYIKTPDENMQIAAASNKYNSLKYIKNPTPSAQIAAINNVSNLGKILFIIDILKIPAEEAQVAIVKRFPRALKYMFSANINPSEQVQIAAINTLPAVFDLIPNPSPKVTAFYNNITNKE